MALPTGFTSALLVIGVAVLSAQQPQPGMPMPGVPTAPQPTPPRAQRPGEDPQKGTAVLRGYVVAADTGSPLRRALVRAFGTEGRSGGMATTDAEGRFEIAELPGGRYNLSVSKAGYVTMSYGQRRPEQQGTILEVLDGQRVEKIAFALPRGGVVTGVVVDEFGDPIAGAQVNALRYRFVGSGRRLVPSGANTTDDRGVFRIYGLAPGDYYVSAALRPQQMMMGPFTPAGSAPVEGYAPTYYPGTSNPSEATRVTIRAGQETAGVSFALIASRLARVSGRAVSSSGAPIVQGMVSAFPADRMATGGVNFHNAMTRADGSFEFAGMAPGTYNVMIRPRGMPGPDSEFATMRITVGSDDLSDLLLVARRGAIARGIITTDDGTPPDFRPQQVTIFSRPLEPDVMTVGGGPPQVRDDWSFELSGLSEPRVVTANVAEAPDWTLKAVLHNGFDITDTGMEFVPGQEVEGLEIVFTRQRTELSGSVTTDGTTPDVDATILAFSQDSARWGFMSRYVRSARPSQDGRYSMRLAPHDYYVIAVKGIEPGQWTDPAFLEGIRDYAVRVSIQEGETKVQDLKVTEP